jgi:hypothetical protein
MGEWSVFRMLNGPAGSQLGTSQGSLARQLGPVQFQTGVIAGNLSIYWINSLFIPGPDDGKVFLASARLDGMQDYVIVRATHAFLMKDRAAMEQVVRFLERGCFKHDEHDAAPPTDSCSTLNTAPPAARPQNATRSGNQK